MKIMLLFVMVVIAEANEVDLLKEIKSTPLWYDGARVVEVSGSIYLIGVGSSPLRGTDVQSKINAIKVAKARAQKAVVLFANGSDIAVNETLKHKIITKKTTLNGKVISSKSSHYKKYVRIIREQGNGILVNLKTLGKWNENNVYHFAYYMQIPK